ncbi:MAG: MGMT family protein [Verrucomicrobiales bacterium]
MNEATRPPTAFETRVYDATRMIPQGKVSTYRDLAAAIGCGSSRAVGQALRRNPFAPETPCHRVIRADLSSGGFSGAVAGPEVERKLHLLALEGVAFDEGGRLADPSQVHRW